MKPFRFWVQTALPLVYDDSLSYYELLCKVVDYINNFANDLTGMGEEITAYSAKVEEIEAYVDGYFDSADFKALVDAALDKMAEDGDFDALLAPVIAAAMEDVNAALEDVESIASGMDSRMTDAESAIGTLQGDVTDIQGDITDIQGDIEDIEGSLEGIGDVWGLVFVGGAGNGDCFYMYKGQKAIVFDAGVDEYATALLASLHAHEITKIVAIVVSHWHSDHIGGFNGLLGDNTLDFNGCVLYRPHHNLDYSLVVAPIDGWPSYIPGRETAITALVTGRGGTYRDPTEGMSVTIEGLRLVFHNLSAEKFTDYYSYTLSENLVAGSSTNYNNFSMGVTAYLGGVKLAFAADFMPPAESNNIGFADGADLYKVEHHGLNVETDNRYAMGIGAKISVVGHYGRQHGFKMRIKTPTVSRCIGVGSLFDSGDGTCEFTVTKHSVICDSLNEPIDSRIYHGQLGTNDTIRTGVDFNTLVSPGVITIEDGSVLALMNNAPVAGAGGKLVIDAVSANGYINQTFIVSNSATPAVYYRCGYPADDPPTTYLWKPWRVLRPSYYADENITNANIVNNRAHVVDSGDTARTNHVIIQNGFITISFYLSIDEAYTGAGSILRLPINIGSGNYTPFLGYKPGTSSPIFFTVGGTGGGIEIWRTGGTLEYGDNVMGSVTFAFNTNYPT